MNLQLIQEALQTLHNLISAQDYSNPRNNEIIKTLKLTFYTIQNIHLQPVQVLVSARRFAQYNVLYSLAVKNFSEFSRAIEKLKFFYQNFQNLQASENYYQLEAIHLLYLLSNNQIQQFYTKLETLESSALHNQYIRYVINLNEAIEEGNYRSVFASKQSSPLVFFNPFLDRIQQTIRYEVARSSEKAYASISFEHALQIFQLKNEQQLRQFISNQNQKNLKNDNPIRWTVQGRKIIFESSVKKMQPQILKNFLQRCQIMQLKYKKSFEDN